MSRVGGVEGSNTAFIVTACHAVSVRVRVCPVSRFLMWEMATYAGLQVAIENRFLSCQ